jgi:hypothetical protein
VFDLVATLKRYCTDDFKAIVVTTALLASDVGSRTSFLKCWASVTKTIPPEDMMAQLLGESNRAPDPVPSTVAWMTVDWAPATVTAVTEDPPLW